MKGIDKITSRILADAEAECAAVRAESDRHCEAIRAENEKRAQDEYWKLVREGVRDTEQRVQRLDRTARLEAKKSILNMKQEAVSRAFELAKDKIAELPERDYIGFLAREAAGAANNRPGGGHLLRAGQVRRRSQGRPGRQRAAGCQGHAGHAHARGCHA